MAISQKVAVRNDGSLDELRDTLSLVLAKIAPT